MNVFRNYRSFAVFATVAAVVAAVAFLFGSAASSPRGAQAAGSPTASVSCSDIYQDISDDTPLGSAHDGDDIGAASSMNRIEPSQSSPGDFDLTPVTYLGPDLVPQDEADIGLVPGDAVPDIIPTTALCNAAAVAANGALEANTMHVQHDAANQYNQRPGTTAQFGTYDATNNEDGGAGGDCGDGIDNGDSGTSPYSLTKPSRDDMDTDCYDFPGSSPDTLVSSGCAYAENSTGWGRTDTFSKIVSKTAKGINYGKNVLMLATSAPTTGVTDGNGDGVGDTAGDPNECTLGLAFPSVSESTIREPSTDEPGLAKNTANSIPTDPSGTGLLDTADGLADDWDGDGCTDWDELDKGFSGTYPVSVTGPVHGTDPFNPADCDENFNSNIFISVIARHNEPTCAAPAPTGGCATTVKGNGNYFRCLGDLTDPKSGGSRAVTLRMSCYSDSPLSVVNTNYTDAAGNATCPPAPLNMCGDGQSGGVPPGTTSPASGQDRAAKPYQDVDAVNYPILGGGTYDKGAGTLSIGGCFASYAAAPIGPHIYGSGAFDSRVGAGTFTVQFGITDLADCMDGPPFSSGANACVLMPGAVCKATIVELQSKKNILTGGSPIPIQSQRNSDRDNCSDSQELRSAQGDGGKRDPFNDYDYMNPTNDKLNRVDDILATVAEYFDDDPPGDIDYTSKTDRTGVPGSNAWNLGPPNGQQRIDDILASVKQYFHDCND
jgi:hypothetical protein